MEKKVPFILRTQSCRGQGYNCVMSFWEWIGVKNGVNGTKSEEELALTDLDFKGYTEPWQQLRLCSFSYFVRMWLEPVKTTDLWFSMFLWYLGSVYIGQAAATELQLWWSPPKSQNFNSFSFFFVLAVPVPHCCTGFPLVVSNGDYSLVAGFSPWCLLLLWGLPRWR